MLLGLHSVTLNENVISFLNFVKALRMKMEGHRDDNPSPMLCLASCSKF